MKKLIAPLGLLPLAASSVLFAATSTTVTATVTDTDGQAWTNGTWKAEVVLPGGSFSGMTVTANGAAVVSARKGTLDSNGVLTAVLPATNSMDQSGVQWKITVCPNASIPPYGMTDCATYTTAVTGTSLDLTSKFSFVAAPRFPAGQQAYGYNDGEVIAGVVGVGYYNTSNDNAGPRVWDGRRWISISGFLSRSFFNGAGSQCLRDNLSFGPCGGGSATGTPFRLSSYNAAGALNQFNWTVDGSGDNVTGTGSFVSKSVGGVASANGYGSFAAAAAVGSVTATGGAPLVTGNADRICATPHALDYSTAGFNECYRSPLGHVLGFYPTAQASGGGVFSGLFLRYFNDAPGKSLGNDPLSINGSWRSVQAVNIASLSSASGITNTLNINSIKLGTGDHNVFRQVSMFSGGMTATADEGVKVNYDFTAQAPIFRGVVVGSPALGATNFTVNGNYCDLTGLVKANQCIGQGRIMLRIAAPVGTGRLLTVPTPPDDSQDGIATLDFDVPRSPAWGTMTSAAVVDTTNWVTGTPATVTIGSLGGAVGAFRSSGTLCMSGRFWESQAYTSIPVAGGTQQVTVTHRVPITAGASFHDGACHFFTTNADRAKTGGDFAWVVTGSEAPNTIRFSNTISSHRGGWPDVSINSHGGFGMILQSSTSVATATRSAGSTAVTLGNPTQGGAYNSVRGGRTVNIAGCSDPTMNGTFPTTTDAALPNAVHYTSTGTTAVSCTVSYGIVGLDQISVYEGARVISTSDQTIPSDVTPGSNANAAVTGLIGVEANEYQFLPGEAVEQPWDPNLVLTFYDRYATASTPGQFAYSVDHLSGPTSWYSLIRLNEPASSYTGHGGNYTPPFIWAIGTTTPGGGLYSSLITAPAPVNSGISFGCVGGDTTPGCQNTPDYTVFGMGGSPGGQVNWSPTTSTLSINAGTFSLGNTLFNPNAMKVIGSLTVGDLSVIPLKFGKQGSVANQIGLCALFGTSQDLCVGASNQIQSTGGGFSPTDTGNGYSNLWANKLYATNGVAGFGVSSGVHTYTQNIGVAYTGTPGTQNRNYLVATVFNGIVGASGSGTGLFNTQQTLSSSNFVTITCPTGPDIGQPAGVTFRIFLLLPGLDGNYRDMGACPVGGSIIDTGQTWPVVTQPQVNANADMYARGYLSYGYSGFAASPSSLAPDAAFSRLGAGSIALGNGTIGDTSGRLSLGNIALAPSTLSSGATCGAHKANDTWTDDSTLYHCNNAGTAASRVALTTF